METSYLPVQWIYREQIQEQIENEKSGKIFYFVKEKELGEVEGKIQAIEESGDGVFIRMQNNELIRIDRIITLFGKPAAAYDEYDAYANACMDCTGGYNKDELEKL